MGCGVAKKVCVCMCACECWCERRVKSGAGIIPRNLSMFFSFVSVSRRALRASIAERWT